MKNPEVLYEAKDGLATITLNRPEKVNALSASMRCALDERLKQATHDETVTVVLLCGAGNAFCGGLDMGDLPDNPMTWRERVLAAQANHLAVVHMPKIVITAAQGAIVGGGASLALSADILIMADNAYLSFPFVRLGIVPDGGSSYFLQAKLGASVAQDLLLTGGKLDAMEAARLGLTRRIVPTANLMSSARELAEELLKLPAEARMLTKSLCRQYWARGLDSVLAHEADAFGLATSTSGHLKAMSRLKSKR